MIAKGLGYIKGSKVTQPRLKLTKHMKYISHRSKEARSDLRIFTKEEEHISRQVAIDYIMQHSNRNVAFHKLVLSPADTELVIDWQEWTRQVVADLEVRQGKQLHWVAVQHDNTAHAHVHLIVAGSGEDRATGKTKVVKLFPPDFRFLEAAGREHSEHDWHAHLHDQYWMFDQEEAPQYEPEELATLTKDDAVDR